MNLNAIWSLTITIISYISFVISYVHMFTDFTWYLALPIRNPFILTEYYGMLRFQPVGTPKLLD